MSKRRITVLGVSGSIRSNGEAVNHMMTAVRESSDVADLESALKALPRPFSNSDIALAYSMFAAYREGAEIDVLSLRNLFKGMASVDEELKGGEFLSDHLAIDAGSLEDMFKRLEAADSVVLSTPVYFGDRSSIANKFLQLTVKNRSLKNKIFGAIGVGAKRNGGQETTCIYCLMEALAQGAIAVGNGPITSQYGGTVVAGDMGSAYEDTWGLDRCLELGRRVVVGAGVYVSGKAKTVGRTLKIGVFMTMDAQDKRFRNKTEDYFKQYEEPGKVTFEYVDLIDDPIKRCIGCPSCPQKGKSAEGKDYNCIVQDPGDCMVKAYETLISSDAIILVGVNSNEDIIYRYQSFTERTRCIRRDNFQLNNIPVVGFLHNDPTAVNNTLHNTKIITSYIRHNTFILQPLQVIYNGNDVVLTANFSNALSQIKVLRDGRFNAPKRVVSYDAEGYSDKSQDGIASVRN